MKIRSFTLGATLLGLGLGMSLVQTAGAQPLYDRINVDMPYSVTLGDKVLPPGDYVITQAQGMTGNNGVLLIYKDHGTKFVTSAMTFAALENRTQDNTRIVLHHIGDDYYFDKIWVQGKDYGYEFALPSKARQREKELLSASVTVPAATSTSTTSTSTETTTIANAAPVTPATPLTEPATPVDNGNEPMNNPNTAAAIPATTPDTSVDNSKDDGTDNNPDMEPNNPPKPNTDEPDADDQPQDSAATPTPSSMPKTSAGWLMMLLSGGTLTGVGAMLRRKR